MDSYRRAGSMGGCLTDRCSSKACIGNKSSECKLKNCSIHIHFYISIGSDNKEFFSWIATSMEEPDDAMVPVSAGEMPIAIYPPLPLFSDHDLWLTQKTTTRTAVLQGSETRRQVEALAHHSAAAYQRNAEQIGQVQLQQDRLAAQTSEYLQAQHDQQASLVEQQEEMRRQMSIANIWRSSTRY
ncbi:unnamed protein product [Phytophthora lilii]|uniref:Unnamed protein product n=1 Tax=Phytophthora lilii TaxID=2077276 RepID=A0A9W6TEG8_9STRA|nr:unnamed protein product [Phytophthora lilii]